jgi:hypothetical protein
MFGTMFLIALAIFPFMYAISWGFEKVLVRGDYGRLINTIIKILCFFGIIVHESCHRVMCAITGVPVDKFSVSYRDRETGIVAPRGFVTPSRKHQITFMQGFLVAFAPLLIGIWIFYFLLLVACNPLLDPLFRIIAVILSISVLLCSQPSMDDLRMVMFHYRNDPFHGIYQIFLLLLSFMTAWITVIIFHIFFPYEFLYYFIIILYYFVFKYSFILLRIAINKIQHRNGKSRYKTKYKQYVRRRQKPHIANGYKNYKRVSIE